MAGMVSLPPMLYVKLSCEEVSNAKYWENAAWMFDRAYLKKSKLLETIKKLVINKL